LTLNDNSYLIATPNHLILKNDLKYTELQNLHKGDEIISLNSTLIVENIEYHSIEDVYDCTVPCNNNFFVVTSDSNGICIHIL
jgi:hypothetical protein